MAKLFRNLVVALTGAFALVAGSASAWAEEARFALVIGNDGYKDAPLATSANDAGLVAETLRSARFDVTGARDLDGDALRRSIRDFLEKVGAAGPDAVALVYLAGYGLQYEGENYFAPVDARIARDVEVPIQAVRVSDLTRPLAGLPAKVKLVVLDAARPTPFAGIGAPLAGGLALVEPDPGMLVAYNAAPGTISPVEQGPYGAYAKALAEMIREGGLPVGDLFERVRLRTSEVTKGAEVPWHASKLEGRFVFLERAPDAPGLAAVDTTAALHQRPLREFPVEEAYSAALARDSVPAYEEFLSAYPDVPLSQRVRAMLAARREALVWRRSLAVNTPDAYWSYLRRYPRGPHRGDAQRRLARSAAQLEPPPGFDPVAYDVPPPPPPELVFLERPVVVLEDRLFVPPPPPPVYILPPPPVTWISLEPPPPPPGAFFLPVPVIAAIPLYVRPPAYVIAPPPMPVQQITIVNQTTTNGVPASRPAQFVPLPPSLVPLVASRPPAPAGAGFTTERAPNAAMLPALGAAQPAQPGRALPTPPTPQPAATERAGLRPAIAPTASIPAATAKAKPPATAVDAPGAVSGRTGPTRPGTPASAVAAQPAIAAVTRPVAPKRAVSPAPTFQAQDALQRRQGQVKELRARRQDLVAKPPVAPRPPQTPAAPQMRPFPAVSAGPPPVVAPVRGPAPRAPAQLSAQGGGMRAPGPAIRPAPAPAREKRACGRPGLPPCR